MYKIQTVKTHSVIEVKRYSLRNFSNNAKREIKHNLTPEAMQRINEKNAINKLRWKINANFIPGDIHLVLTYRAELRPCSKCAKKILSKYLRNLRKVYKKVGKELKYICVTEYLNSAIHHHLIINAIDTALISDLWEYGRPWIKILDATGEYSKLAEYFVKETRETFNDENCVAKKRWSCSRNLINPEIEKTEEYNNNKFYLAPENTEEFVVINSTVETKEDLFTGLPVMEYRMIRYKKENKLKTRNFLLYLMKHMDLNIDSKMREKYKLPEVVM